MSEPQEGHMDNEQEKRHPKTFPARGPGVAGWI